MFEQRPCSDEALPSAPPALDLSRESLEFYDTLLPSLRGLAATAHALGYSTRRDSLSGERLSDAIFLLADHLDRAADLLQRSRDIHGAP